MQLNPTEITDLIKQRIDKFEATSEARTEGTVVGVTDGINWLGRAEKLLALWDRLHKELQQNAVPMACWLKLDEGVGGNVDISINASPIQGRVPDSIRHIHPNSPSVQRRCEYSRSIHSHHLRQEILRQGCR